MSEEQFKTILRTIENGLMWGAIWFVLLMIAVSLK